MGKYEYEKNDPSWNAYDQNPGSGGARADMSKIDKEEFIDYGSMALEGHVHPSKTIFYLNYCKVSNVKQESQQSKSK